jgi:hypothetical protein
MEKPTIQATLPLRDSTVLLTLSMHQHEKCDADIPMTRKGKGKPWAYRGSTVVDCTVSAQVGVGHELSALKQVKVSVCLWW